MALIGVGCAPVLMGSLYVFGRAYPPERFAMLASLMIGISALGNLLAATPMAYAVELFGWRASMAGIAALTAASTALVLPRAGGPAGPGRLGLRSKRVAVGGAPDPSWPSNRSGFCFR